MSDSKVKMHHIPFPLGSDPDPTVFRAGLPGTSKRREGKGKEKRRKRRVAPFQLAVEGGRGGKRAWRDELGMEHAEGTTFFHFKYWL